MTSVKLSGRFDEIIANTIILRTVALWEMCHRMFFPRNPNGKIVT